MTNVGTYKYLTHLTGNVGTNSGSSTNFGNVNGVMHDGDGASLLCASDLLFAYNSLSALATDSTLGSVIGNGTTIRPGTYLMPGATSLSLSLTLNAQGNPSAVFVFKTPSAVAYAFTADPNSKIRLINGAQACNVFWQVSGAVNIGAGATIRGNIIAHGAISMAAQDTLEGRALTVNGAITVSNGALGFLAYTPIGCGSPVLIGPTAPVFVGLASYEVFASVGAASDCGSSRIIGDVGGNTVPPTGFNPDSITGTIHFNDPSTQAAAADLLLVYDYLLNLPYDINLLDPAEFGHNLVLTPHSYTMNAAVSFTDTVYLNAMGNVDAVFVIKTYGAFASSVGANVVLMNGTQAKNVYWFVTGAVSIGDNSKFKGAIIAHDAIQMLPGAKIDGRVFSTNGALTTCGITAGIPSIISSGPDDQTACEGSSVSFSVTAAGTGLTYQWRKGANNLTNGGNISGATSPTLTINPVGISDAASNYNVIITGTIPSITSRNATLTVNPLPAAVAGTNRGICINTSTTLGASTVIGSTYSWTSVPAGFTSTIANPTATPLVTTTYTVIETITATGCANTHSVVVTANPRPVPTITGENNLCVNSGFYNYNTEANQNGYAWTVSSGGTITWGQGTSQLQVVWNKEGPQSVTLNYNNLFACQAETPTTFNVTVTTPPDPAGIITGTATVCQGDMGVTYSVGTITNADSYVWSLPAGTTLVSGFGSNSITVDFAANSFSGPITVNGNNLCGDGSASPAFNVTVYPLPATPTITADGYVLSSNAPDGNQWYHDGNIIADAVAQTYTVPASDPGFYWTIVTLLNCSSSESNHLYIQGVGIGETTISKYEIYPVPNDGRFTVSLTYPQATSFNINIYNQLGVMIYNKKDILVNGTTEQQIDIRSAASGIYTVVFTNNESKVIRKILVNK